MTSEALIVGINCLFFGFEANQIQILMDPQAV